MMAGPDGTRELVIKAQAGDARAFESLMECHNSRLVSFIGLRLGERLLQRLEFDDVFQEVLYQVYRALPRFQWLNEGCFFPWLSTIAEHVIQSLGRKHSPSPKDGTRPREVPLGGQFAPEEAEDGSAGSDRQAFIAARGISPSKTMRQNERFERLKVALDGLSADHREVIILARVQGLSMKEIGDRMHRTPEAASALLLRALRQLKAAFGNTDSMSLPPRSLEKPGEAGDSP